MACMNDYETVQFICGYEPCKHEGSINFHKHNMDKFSVHKCPECGIWNYSHSNFMGQLIDKAGIKKLINTALDNPL